MVDIIIVNWNSGDFLEKCIKSIFSGNSASVVQKLIIIDNNTSDDSLARIPDNPKILVVVNEANLGFAKAANQGFRLSTAPFVLLLNPDTQLFESTLADCINFMTKNAHVDVLGCQLLNNNGGIAVSCARFPTPVRIFYDALGLSKVAPKFFKPATLMTDWNHQDSRYVDEVMGAFMFMRNSIFKKTGYFDERFFVYYEELDFSKRLSKVGGTSYYETTIKAIHSENGTTRSIKAIRLFLYLRSRLQYAKKHFSYFGYLLVWLSTYLIEPFTRALLLLFSRRSKEIKDVLVGYKLLIKNPSFFERRVGSVEN